MKLLPIINSLGFMENGQYIQALPYCLTNCNRGKCAKFYEKLRSSDKNSTFITCPHGMSVYLSPLDNVIYSCVRERRTHDNSKSKAINADVYNPVLNDEQIIQLIKASQAISIAKAEIEEKSAMVENVSHEVIKLNGQILEHSDLAMGIIKIDDDVVKIDESKADKLLDELRTIYLSSCMISSRYSLFNYEKDPDTLKGTQVDCQVYKKFDKIRRIFRNYQKKNIHINISGNSYKNIRAYRTFELIPLLIIENAVKYTYNEAPVEIVFEEGADVPLKVSIESYSPYCSKDELNKIFEKGFRGKNATRTATGSGIGLYFVKLLCDIHNISIEAVSNSKRIANINGIAYAPFTIYLRFNQAYNLE